MGEREECDDGEQQITRGIRLLLDALHIANVFLRLPPRGLESQLITDAAFEVQKTAMKLQIPYD